MLVEKKDILDILKGFVISLLILFIIMIFLGFSLKNILNNSTMINEKYYKTYKVLDAKAIKYSDEDKIRFYVTLIDENNKQSVKDDYELFELVKKHKNQNIIIGYNRKYYNNNINNKIYFYKEKILKPYDIKYTELETENYDEIEYKTKEKSNVNNDAENYMMGLMIGNMMGRIGKWN